MKRLLSAVKTAAKWQRILALLLSLVFMLSAVMTGTAAWADIRQHKTNIAQGEGSPKPGNAILQKYEKDKDGRETEISVPGAEFTLYKINADGTASRIDTYITGSDGQILATDLESGEYYWQETHPAIGFLPETENGQQKKYHFSLPTEDGKPALSTAYNTRQQGRLALTKTVKNNDDSPLSQAQKDMLFEFTIAFSDGGSYDYSIDGGPSQTVASGGKIYLKSGQTAQFNNIPAGIHYEIIETPVSGYTTSSENNAGNVPKDGITAAFTNTYDSISGEDFQLTVTKRVNGNVPEKDKDKLFHFILTINGSKHKFDLKPGQTSEAFTVHPGDVYSLAEQNYTADGYIQSGVVNGSGIISNKDVEIIQFNSYVGPEYIGIKGVKTWNTDGAPAGTQLPDSITILLKNGDVVVRTATAKKDNNWKYEFKNLPKYNALGKEIRYTVEEVRVPGWRPVVSGYNIKNIYQAPVTDGGIEVEKAITGADPPADETFTFILTPVNGAPMPSSNEIRITSAGRASFGKITYTMPGTYIYTITEVDGGIKTWSYDASVYTLAVTVTEDDGGQLKASKTLTKNGTPAEKALFTNRYDDSGETLSVRVTKVWKGEDDNRPQSIQIQLYKDGKQYGNPATLSIANNWTRVWSGLDKYSVWTLKEVNVPESYTDSISGDQVNGFVITNTKDGSGDEKTDLKVTKVWRGKDENRPKSVAVQLYKDGVAVNVPVILSDANGWTYTWNNLEKGPEWTVNELNVPDGYSRAVTGDAVNGFVITNTKNPATSDSNDEEVSISGKKTWNHGSNPIDDRPTSITLIVKANGVIISQHCITADEHWNWSFRLPRYDSDGKEIVYTVDESHLENYVKTVDGYNLINTYGSGGNTDDPDPDAPGGKPGYPDGSSPKTGDESNMMFWMVFMLISFAALILSIIPWRRKWDGKQYVPKY